MGTAVTTASARSSGSGWPVRGLAPAQPPREGLGVGEVDEKEVGAADGLQQQVRVEHAAGLGRAARGLGPQHAERDAENGDRRAQALSLERDPAREGLRREPAADRAGERRPRRGHPAGVGLVEALGRGRERRAARNAVGHELPAISSRGTPVGLVPRIRRDRRPLVARPAAPRHDSTARRTPRTAPRSGVQRRASSAAAARTSSAASGLRSSSASTETAKRSQRSRLGQSMSTPGRSSGGRASRASRPSHGHSAGNAGGSSTMRSDGRRIPRAGGRVLGSERRAFPPRSGSSATASPRRRAASASRRAGSGGRPRAGRSPRGRGGPRRARTAPGADRGRRSAPRGRARGRPVRRAEGPRRSEAAEPVEAPVGGPIRGARQGGASRIAAPPGGAPRSPARRGWPSPTSSRRRRGGSGSRRGWRGRGRARADGGVTPTASSRAARPARRPARP